MKRLLLTWATLCLTGLLALAQVPHRMVIPDVAGYKTLKGDMHIHTVFSDGSVWPTTRIDEAMMEGLDFIAITDHMDERLQKQKQKGLMNNDRNDSYKIAAARGKENEVLVIHGGEITRGMPPGHFNTTFISDGNAIAKAIDAETDDYKSMDAGLRVAREQGGFLVWNHPHWSRQAPNGAKWYDEHTKLLKAGLMQGIEIFNQFEGVCKEAFHWAVTHGLTIVSGTDAHQPLFKWMDMTTELRPVTLVFAKERTEQAIHEALLAHRTAVFAEGKVYGMKENILPLNEAVLTVKKANFSEKKVKVVLHNSSSIPIILTKAPGGEAYIYPTYILLQPFGDYAFDLSMTDRDKPLDKTSIDMPFRIENFYTDADVALLRTIRVSKK